MKDLIGSACHSIIANPELNLIKLKQLVYLIDLKRDEEWFKLGFITFQKLVAFAALEIFKDLIPSYVIQEQIKEETPNNKKRLKKSTYELRNFETQLLAIYKIYLIRIKRMVQVIKKSQRSTFYDNMLTSREAKEKICLIGLKCLSQLIITHPHFNFREIIIQLIVPLLTVSKYSAVCDSAFRAVTMVYKQDKLGQVSLLFVKETEKLIKSCGILVNPIALSTFLYLKVDQVVEKAEDRKDMKKIREGWKKMSRKERRKNKEKLKLDAQWLEIESKESDKKRAEFNTKILNHVFVTYFRILKRTLFDLTDDSIKKEKFKSLLNPVLEGLAKYASLINAEYFDDLVNVLHKLMSSDLLDINHSLYCNQTVFEILSDEGKILGIDPQRFYTRLYSQLSEIDTSSHEKTIEILLHCLDSMILKQRKQVSFSKVLAFIKRLTVISLAHLEPASLALLLIVFKIIHSFPKSDILLDTDYVGSGFYHQFLDDPEHCNAAASNLWEFSLLKNHHDPEIQQFSLFVTNTSKDDRITNHYLLKSTLDVYEEQKSKSFERFFMNQDNQLKLIPKKTKFHGYTLKEESLTRKSLKMLFEDNQ